MRVRQSQWKTPNLQNLKLRAFSYSRSPIASSYSLDSPSCNYNSLPFIISAISSINPASFFFFFFCECVLIVVTYELYNSVIVVFLIFLKVHRFFELYCFPFMLLLCLNSIYELFLGSLFFPVCCFGLVKYLFLINVQLQIYIHFLKYRIIL